MLIAANGGYDRNSNPCLFSSVSCFVLNVHFHFMWTAFYLLDIFMMQALMAVNIFNYPDY